MRPSCPVLPFLAACAGAFLLGGCGSGTPPLAEDGTAPPATLADAQVVYSLKVEGMTCGNCALHVHDALAAFDFFVADEIDPATGLVKAGFLDPAPSREEVNTAIQQAGYTVLENH